MIGKRVGILGGGQLARMLVEAALRLGLRPLVLAGAADEPAAQLCPAAVLGTWHDVPVMRRLFRQVECVTFENEFVPCETADEAARGTAVQFLPGLGAIFGLQDKIRQKEILARLGIPSAEYLTLPKEARKPAGRAAWLDEVARRFGEEYVLKWAQLGYDGKGTHLAEPGPAGRAAAEAFAADAVKRGVPLFAERRVRYRREVAMVAAYSIDGELATWPLVISRNRAGICRWVMGPATRLGVDPKLQSQAQGFARLLAVDLKLYGVFAIEMFETEDGRLLVNELAPRVHNTGHYTQDAAATSQFENHWRALLGLGLGDTRCDSAFVMLNLLGPAGAPGPAPDHERRSFPKLPGEAHLHWYGKTELRPGRKLGHVNATLADPARCEGLLRELEGWESALWSRLGVSDKTEPRRPRA
jgi:5-(carboxyamino)imidazole ribonucleotide synthase